MTDDLAAALARADAAEAELAQYRAKGAPPAVVKKTDGPRYFYRSAIRDPKIWAENRKEILAAAALGRILPDPDEPDWRVSAAPTAEARREAARKAGQK